MKNDKTLNENIDILCCFIESYSTQLFNESIVRDYRRSIVLNYSSKGLWIQSAPKEVKKRESLVGDTPVFITQDM